MDLPKMETSPLVNMAEAEKAVAQAIAQVERELNSAIKNPNGMPQGMLLITRAQLFGMFAQVRIHNYLCGMHREKGPVLQ